MKLKVVGIKVDTLKHISDHALKCKFDGEHFAAMMEALKPDGVFEIEAGQSKITIHRLGRVTRTRLYMAVGSTTTTRIHYLSEGLSFTVSDSDEVQTLSHIIFGIGSLPTDLEGGRSGAACDVAKGWISSHGWALAGEAGLRAKAIAKEAEIGQGRINAAKQIVYQFEREERSLINRDAKAEIESAKNIFKSRTKEVKQSKKELEECRNTLEAKLKKWAQERHNVHQTTFVPAQCNPWLSPLIETHGRYNEKGELASLVLRLPGNKGSVSHPCIAPNYTAQWVEGEDRVSLSSGVHCDIKPSELLAWLHNPTLLAPRSNYGVVTKKEVAMPGTLAPWVAICCGCHILDLRNLGEEWEKALAPSHVVTSSGYLPEVEYSEGTYNVFVERLNAALDAEGERLEKLRKDYFRLFFEKVKECKDFETNKGAHLAEAQANIHNAKAQLAATQAENDASKPVGADLATIKAAVLTVANAFTAQFKA